MKAKSKKQSKARKSLKGAKKLEAQKPLSTYKFSEVFITNTSWGDAAGGGGN